MGRATLSNLSDFFTRLYGRSTGHVVIATRSEHGTLDSERWLSVPDELDFLERYVELRKDEDTYYSVSVFSEEERTSDDTLAVTNVVWADADICSPEMFRLPPSMVVQTSPAHGDNEDCPPRTRTGMPCRGHFHTLWVLDKEYDAHEVQEVARSISYAHKAQGCDLGWSMTKYLRAPDTSNTKDGVYHIGDAEINDRVYTLAEIREAYPEDTTENKVPTFKAGDVPALITGDDFLDLEEREIEPNNLTHLYLDKPKEGESWSERAFKLEIELFRSGCTDQEVFSLVQNAACNKYRPDMAGEVTQTGVPIPKRRDPLKVLWLEILKAKAEYERDYEVEVEAETRPEQKLSLMTLDERRLVEENPTFIDEYVDWALSRSPDSLPTYSRSLAWMVLSCAYADRMFLDLKWGETHPNLWVMILGPSTRGHKSAATKRMIDFVHKVEDADGGLIDIGSDATAEKLINVMGTRSGEVSLICTDEINGFLRENILKNYRTGTLENYTKLYDGTVPVVLRSTKGSGNTQRAKCIFNLVGVGIHEQVAATLTREQFTSGFLLRTTWAIGDPPKYRKGDSDLHLSNDSPTTGDVVLREMVRTVVRNRSRYERDKPLSMSIAPTALDRINQFVNDLHSYTLGRGDEVLDAGVDRLRDSVVKAAGLLSYHNGLKQIEDFEMLVAIRQGEVWFHDFERMLSEVSSSAFGRTCDEVEQFIMAGADHSRPESSIYRHFTMRPNEFNDTMQALTRQGRIKKEKGKWRVLI